MSHLKILYSGINNKKHIPNGAKVSSLGSLCLRLSRLSWRSLAMMAAMEKSVAQGRAEHSSSIAVPCRSRPSPCSSIKLIASDPRLPADRTSPSEHPIELIEHDLCNVEWKGLAARNTCWILFICNNFCQELFIVKNSLILLIVK